MNDHPFPISLPLNFILPTSYKIPVTIKLVKSYETPSLLNLILKQHGRVLAEFIIQQDIFQAEKFVSCIGKLSAIAWKICN